MRLLIDGYNLMYDAGFTHELRGARGLERSRNALLRCLASLLSAEQAATTVIVFDASDAPPGLPPTIDFHGIQVHFARDHSDADEMIEELVRADSAPKQLLVVSSDHRLHRAARRRKATPIDSGEWFEQLARSTPHGGASTTRTPGKPTAPPVGEELQNWVDLFSGEELEQIVREESEPPVRPGQPSQEKKASKDNGDRQRHPSPAKPPSEDTANPFPPGYGEDLDFEI